MAVAPALFDRTERDFQCGYTPEEVAIARKFVANPDWAAMLRDTDAALKEVKSAGPSAIMGFCMGGTVSFLAAAGSPGSRPRSATTAAASGASPTRSRNARRRCTSAARMRTSR